MKNHDYDDEPMPVYDDQYYPVAKEIDGYLYDPPSWKVCDECGGKGFINGGYKPRIDDAGYAITCKCPKCADSPRPGYVPIHYTPEEWEAAGGVLTDDTVVWQRSYRYNALTDTTVEEWGARMYHYCKQDLVSDEHMIIATDAGKPGDSNE